MHNAQCVKHNGEIPRFAWNLFLLTAIYYKKILGCNYVLFCVTADYYFKMVAVTLLKKGVFTALCVLK